MDMRKIIIARLIVRVTVFLNLVILGISIMLMRTYLNEMFSNPAHRDCWKCALFFVLALILAALVCFDIEANVRKDAKITARIKAMQ